MWRRKITSSLLATIVCGNCNFALADSIWMTSNPTTQSLSQDAPPDERSELAFSAMPVPSAEKKHDAPLVEKYLIEGRLADGEIALLAKLEQHSDDDQLRFGLGLLQFLRAVERLAQDVYRYGIHDWSALRTRAPFMQLPLPCNPNPETLSYADARKIAQTFLDKLRQSEATLAQITHADVKLPIHFGLIKLDLNHDGQVSDDESFWKLYASLSGSRNISPEKARAFLICFDRGDVHWLRGYCHLIMAVCEVYLAHDSRETFERTAHLLFPKVDSPYKFLSKGKRVHRMAGEDIDILDVVALVHLIRWPVVEKQRMVAALHHLQAVVAQSKESWKWILAETDDDHEWLPNPQQTGVIPNVSVTQEMVDAWLDAMDEADKLLKGELLIPFWRGDDDRLGVNLQRVFTEPTTLDLVLWVQGTAAAPYLQRGNLTKPGSWRRLPQEFGSHLPGFALWFN